MSGKVLSLLSIWGGGGSDGFVFSNVVVVCNGDWSHPLPYITNFVLCCVVSVTVTLTFTVKANATAAAEASKEQQQQQQVTGKR